ncbi:MAG: TonB-dependent receptor, partial [Pseudomonadota bacterium]|nr:TonB-dependent receptor [Pseudomonadota bacterium]
GRAKPEKVTHFEVGYSGRSRQNHVDWNFSAYHMRYEDIIWFNVVPDPSDPSDNFYLSPRNSGYYTVSGVEGEVIYRLGQYHFYRILFNMAHDDDLHHNAVEPKNVIKSRDKTPSATIGAVGSWQWRSINCGLNAFYVDTMNWSNQSDTVNANFRLDTHLGTQLSLNSQTYLSLRIGAQNINGTYQEFDNDIDIEPRYYISASLEGF